MLIGTWAKVGHVSNESPRTGISTQPLLQLPALLAKTGPHGTLAEGCDYIIFGFAHGVNNKVLHFGAQRRQSFKNVSVVNVFVYSRCVQHNSF